jgi:pre-rRNA-processing protein TSR1
MQLDAPRVLSLRLEEHCESLVRENEPDPLAGEQTWPSEAEMADAAKAAQKPATRLGRRPRGWSDYQAAWILDEDASGSDVESERDQDANAAVDGGEAMEDDAERPASPPPSDEEADEDFLAEGEQTQDEAMAAARHDSERRLQLRRAADAAAEDVDGDFPDEVDVAPGASAAQRFARYRGLKSFRSSPWDPYESLPQDYGRIFAFQCFSRTRRRALEASLAADAPGGAAAAGSRVACRLLMPLSVARRVQAAFSVAGGGPLVLLGLLQHEAKLSMLHCCVSKAASLEEPLKSKASLEMHIGFRRVGPACTLFSTDGSGDKFKLERFLKPRQVCVATLFGPITYGPAPVLAFDPASGELAATGTLRPVAPERVILKRAIITGFPAKVHKRKAVVRFMFHNPEDVRWFRPLELWTKLGRHGKIREPVGTHGSMKAAFDGVVQQRDTICASLYKRVFPKLAARDE